MKHLTDYLERERYGIHLKPLNYETVGSYRCTFFDFMRLCEMLGRSKKETTTVGSRMSGTYPNPPSVSLSREVQAIGWYQ